MSVSRSGLRASRRCKQALADAVVGLADLVLIREVSRLSEDTAQLVEQILRGRRSRLAVSRDDRHRPTR